MGRAKHNSGIHRHPRSKDYCFAFKAQDGRWLHKYTGTDNRTQAKAFKLEFLEDLRRGDLPTDTARWTVERAAKEWLDLRKAQGFPPSTFSKDRNVLTPVRKHFGRYRLEEITFPIIEAYQAKGRQPVTREVKGKEVTRTVSAYCINREVRYLATLLKRAKLWRRIEDDYVPLREQASSAGRALTPEEARRLVTVAQDDPHLQYVGWCAALALNSGLRGVEIKALQLGNIGSDRIKIKLQTTDGKRGTKTEAGERTVPLNEIAQTAIARLQERARMKRATEPGHYLLPSDNNPSVRLGSFRKKWKALRDKAGLPGLRFHDLRHSFVTWCAQRGVPIGIVQSMVGHRSPQVTQIYQHFNDPSTRPVAELVGSLLAAPKPELQSGTFSQN